MASTELLRALATHLRLLGRLADALAMLRLLSQHLCRRLLEGSICFVNSAFNSLYKRSMICITAALPQLKTPGIVSAFPVVEDDVRKFNAMAAAQHGGGQPGSPRHKTAAGAVGPRAI